MARIYPALLVIATALAVAACLRPNAAEELIKLVGAVRAAGEREACAAPPSVTASWPAEAPRWQPQPVVTAPGVTSPESEWLSQPGEPGESTASDGGRASSAVGPPRDSAPPVVPSAPYPPAPPVSAPPPAEDPGRLALPEDKPDRRFPPTGMPAVSDQPAFADPTVRLGQPSQGQVHDRVGEAAPLASVPLYPETTPGRDPDPFGDSLPGETATAREGVTRLPKTDSLAWRNPDQEPQSSVRQASAFTSPFGDSADITPGETRPDPRLSPPAAGISTDPEAPRRVASRADGWPAPVAEAGRDLPVPRAEISPLVAETKAAGESPHAPAEMRPCEGAQILARVGSEVILASEILPIINEKLQPYKDKMPPSQYEETQRQLVRQRLEQQIEMKRIYLDAKSTIPAEGLKKFEEEMGKQFVDEELPKLMKKAGMKSYEELEKHLAGLGSSPERQKRAYIENALASTWVYQQTKHDDDIAHEEIRAYYEKHLDDYKKPARARWEELSVTFTRHPDKAQAYDLIARMGNQVLDGAPFAEVARRQSEGATAPKGGAWDWTGQGVLVSQPLDQALYSLPVGQLSPILEDEEGFHIIRVVERHDAGVTPFADAQAEIKEKLRDERKKQRFDEFSQRLKRQIPAWTVFDGDQPSAISDQRSAISGQQSAISDQR